MFTMVHMPKRGTDDIKTFSVRLTAEERGRLEALGNRHDPTLSKSFLVRLAVKELLDKYENRQMSLRFAEPETHDHVDQ